MTELTPEQALAQFKKNHAQQGETQENSTQSKGKADGQVDIQTLIARMNIMEQKLEESTKEKAKLQTQVDAYKDKENEVQSSKDTKATADIIQGFKEKFVKDYHFPVLDGKDITFHIVMHAANLAERAQMASLVGSWVQGYENAVPNDILYSLQAIAAFQTVGDEYPKALSDPKEIYRTDILTTVYSDYIDWLATFQSKQQF